MRLLFFIALIFVFSCGQAADPAAAETAIIGSWKIMRLTKERVPVDRITETGMIGGSMTFKADNTFDGEITYPQTPESNFKISGTYSVEDGTLTVINHINKSTTRSRLHFEGDFMIATPENPEAFIGYYQRLP